ncbi:MAG: TonB-dependent receptor [Bacteroidota bacterium]|nr:TonB-dependent receptor [Bacteroidota bacterium]
MTQSFRINSLPFSLRYILLTILFSLNIFSGTTGKISGRVTDSKTNESLVGTNIILTGTNLGGIVDLDGYYSILNIPPGNYEVQFRFIGYRTYVVKHVQIMSDNTTKLDASMQEDVVTTDVVIITAEKPVVQVNLTSTVATVSDKDIKMLPVQELQDIVNLQAGVVDGHFRGGREGEVQYQVNGVSINNAYDNKSSIKIDRSIIQEVQVITGTFDAEYGQAMSGVVNTVLKSGNEQFDWNAEVYGGDFLYGNGGKRGLTYKAHPFSTQSFQTTMSGPTGIPQTYFLFNGRHYVFDDYLYGTRTFKSIWLPIKDTLGSIVGYDSLGDGKEVPLGYKREWSGLGKITNKSIEGIEISYQGLFNYSEGVNTDRSWMLNPDGRKTQKTFSLVHGIDITHLLSPSTYYTISLHENLFEYKDLVYENFYDTQYDRAGSTVTLPNSDIIMQGVDFGRFRQKTDSYIGKISLMSQVSRDHQIKVGAEFQYSDLQFGTSGTLVYLTEGGVTKLIRYVDLPPDYPGIQFYKPISGATYVQDLIEWNDLTIRAGVRFEYFDARSTLPSDLANPANAISGSPDSHPKAASIKTSYAPRLGVSYPITTTSGIFFSYGHFYQLPPLRDMFSNSNYNRLARIQGATSDYGVLGNPDVKPERTVQYEFGYKNALSDVLGLSVNLFYKDIRDLLGVEFISTYNDAQYSRLTNVDFGNVSGFTISLSQRRVGIVSSSVDYTWQTAQGNSSDPAETARLAESKLDARPKQIPLNWDQRQTLNASIQLSEPNEYSISTIVKYGSGLPYTPAFGSGFGSLIESNSGRKPMGLTVDLRAEKGFSFGGLQMNAFLRVFNLFNTTYFNGDVFATTGSPDYTVNYLGDRLRLANPLRYFPPRRLEIGISLSQIVSGQ